MVERQRRRVGACGEGFDGVEQVEPGWVVVQAAQAACIGLGAGGLTAWMGQGFGMQLLVASAIAVIGCLAVQRQRAAAPTQAQPQRNENVQIDLGNVVTVDAWQTDGTAQVQYRGAQWSVKLDAGQGVANAGAHSIVAMQGNTLVLKPV